MVTDIIHTFEEHRNEERAEKMAAYMRNQFPFFGIMADQRKALQKEIFPILNETIPAENRWCFIRELWEIPQREITYFAIDWANTFKPKNYPQNMIEEIHFLITNKSWWDSVDGIAVNLLGKYNKQFPEMQNAWLPEWRKAESFWLRRSCILFQLKYKDRTDFKLLKQIILENLSDKEFFVQKAIGWSLREYAKSFPDRVREFVESANIQGLAKREALKNIK